MHSIFQKLCTYSAFCFALLCYGTNQFNHILLDSFAGTRQIYMCGCPCASEEPWRISVNNIYRSEGKYDITTTKQCTTNYCTLDIPRSKVHESRYSASPTKTPLNFKFPITDSLLLMWINFNPAWINNYITPKCGMKLFINSHTSTVAAIEVWEWRKIFSSHIFWACDYLSMLGL